MNLASGLGSSLLQAWDTHHQEGELQEHGPTYSLSPHTWKPDPALSTDGKTPD